ncbi:response regulator [Desulfosarcina ovata]|uniref:Histidine kinase n=1 Tax=Desulfosarcina ovata subsp. ovata TaxID=2752305 RepID=A0A5K8A9M6_9BACT|nr:response regulator [Desulfosarcina ovata]BBO89403.1 hypothetical protein DSCOOX_25830 [Desulfosarcina ovata subsp. ovata]
MNQKIGKALVVGAGISGIRAAIDLAQMGYGVTLIDRAAHMGGILSQLDRQFPSDRCGMCRMLPMTDRDSGIQTCLRKGLFHERIDILLGTTLIAVDGEPGKFDVILKQAPAPVDPERCNGCGQCAAVCPVAVPDAFNAGLTQRKAIYLPVPHNLPNTYTIDTDACTRCGACEPVCPTEAIRLSATGRRAFRILVVDDEAIIRNSLDAWLGDEEGYNVTLAASGAEAVEKLSEGPFHLMLVDIKMPGMSGVEVLEKARAIQPDLQVLMMTAYATVETAVEAMKIGAMDYLIKPFEPDDLTPKVTAVYDAFEATTHLKHTVGAVVLATGTVCFDPSTGKNPMGYGVVPNVVTGLELERMLSGCGPDAGQLLRPSDKRPVKKAVWIQCVGSRDLQCGADFCSTICCMFALKEMTLARQAADADFEASMIYMDLRTFGKSFDRYGQAVMSADGVRLIRGRVHSIAPTPGSDDVTLRWSTASEAVHEEAFDLVVLSVGQRPAAGVAEMAEALGIETDPFGFVKTASFSETRTARPGILAGGTLTGPTDIAESAIRASAAALGASQAIHRAGGGLAEEKSEPTACRDVSGQPPRILVLLCRCQSGEHTDAAVDALSADLEKDPAVVRVNTMDHICTADGWKALSALDTGDVNRVLLGVCRPFAYGRRMRELAGTVSLAPALVDAAIMDEHLPADAPTNRAALLAGIARLKNCALEAPPSQAAVNHTLVVGGGIAGMHAALAVADHGVPVTLVETSDRLGGNLTWLHETIDGLAVRPFLEETVGRIDRHPGIRVITESRVAGAFGQAGHFLSTIETAGGPTETLEHGAVILATGGGEATTDAYGHGTSDRVVTQRELEQRIGDDTLDAGSLKAVVMILCVGSREDPRNYCSRVCCPTALKQALWLKKRNPELAVYIIYRDMMTCGTTEAWFTEARRQGILFFQYRPEAKPVVTVGEGETITIGLHDPILDAPVAITADLLVLATGIASRLPMELTLAYGLAPDENGFFQEADSKWRPVEAMQAGVLACGIALAPRSIAESVATADAAAGRTLAMLNSVRLPAARTTAVVRHSLCTLCLRCIDTCPYGARFLNEDRQQVQVNPAQCQGCGDCATVCLNNASIVEGFSQRSLFGAIDGAMAAM